ncbi:hypothetical protein [Desulforamulus reducens]|uniref:hypothetical protein n=1 Tax=Desulforamulus reducens TaxID=59610 RepID=UPI0002E061FF|nr:hypothetical protein [Desulforamulus reducens]
MGEVFYQLIILLGCGYVFWMIVKCAGNKVIAELIKFATFIGAAFYVVSWVIAAFTTLNDKCNNWFKIF